MIFSIRKEFMQVRRGNEIVRVAGRHLPYLRDVILGFDYYFEAVEPLREGRRFVVDYSHPKLHSVTGFNLMQIHFPSFAEPLDTTHQYLQHAQLSEGQCVIDLGAYAALTSIIFKEQVGDSGVVIAVEADPTNITSSKINLDEYMRRTGREIFLVEAAIWKDSGGVDFRSDGNMGARVLTDKRLDSKLVPSLTLSDLIRRIEVSEVHFIKADVEGAESVIFEDTDFFSRMRPRMVVEVHAGVSHEKLESDLQLINYSFDWIAQPGVEYPLLFCSPN